MFRYSTEYTSALWSIIERLTLLHPYTTFQEQVADAYTPYAYVVKRYSDVVRRQIHPLGKEYLRKHSEVAHQNVALLKNSIELWRKARSTSDAVAPLLYHYSWHCLNSFFAYTLFRWEPQHSSSHGVKVVLNDKQEDIRVQIQHTGKSLLQRLIDTWTLLGVPLAFSPFLPNINNGEMNFVPNSNYLPNKLQNESGYLPLPQLLTFDPEKFENDLFTQDTKRELPYTPRGISSPNATLKSYLVFFVASTLARYRPVQWHSILGGKTKEDSEFALFSNEALKQYTGGGTPSQEGFLAQVNHIFNDIKDGHFKFIDRDGQLLRT